MPAFKTDPLYSDFFQTVFNEMSKPFELSSNTFPLMDIMMNDKTKDAYLCFALAGYKKEDISVSFDPENPSVLIVSGEMTAPFVDLGKEEQENLKPIEQNISKRKFRKKVPLTQKYTNGYISASMNDGILVIKLTPIVPEVKKIEIN